MAVSEFKFLNIAEADLQSTLEAQLALGFWLVPGGEGLATVTSKGFSFTKGSGAHVSGTDMFKCLFWDQSVALPTDVIAVLGVPESDVDTAIAAALVSVPDAVVTNVFTSAKPSGEVVFDFILQVLTGTVEGILDGSGAPSDGLGANGDMYINTANGDVYGPKAAGTWTGTIFGSLRRNLLSGSAVPTDGVPGTGTGQTGDFYVRTGTLQLYGPKGATAWGSAIGSARSGGHLLSGAGAPTDGVPGVGTGENGDFYLRTSNLNIYGPKTADAWGAAIAGLGAANP